ncbi:MAG TPA: hypothetical protein VFY12_02925 [Arenimonas sp.]|nr:hypothetical protein [Arenimonas sp.]
MSPIGGGDLLAPRRRSWLAHISAGLGLLGVLCFYFRELLTSRHQLQRNLRAAANAGWHRRCLRARHRLIAVTASTMAMDAMVASDAIKARVQPLLLGLQFVLAHANIKFSLDLGWFEYLLVTPRYRHWRQARPPLQQRRQQG